MFTMPFREVISEMLGEVIPLFDVLYAWVKSLLTGNFSLSYVREELAISLGEEIAKIILIYLIFVFVTAIVEEFFPKASKILLVEYLCVAFAIWVNAIISGSGEVELMHSLFNTTRGIFIFLLVIGCAVVFIRKILTGENWLILVQNAGLHLAEKILILSMVFLSTAFLLVIIDTLTSDLSVDPEMKILKVLYSLFGMICLVFSQFIVSRIFKSLKKPLKSK